MPEQSRRHGIGARVTRDAYHALDRVGAASTNDAQRLIAAGVRSDRIRITGDTRYDQAWARAYTTPQNVALVSPLHDARPKLVAGSTWPADEAQLLPAWKTLVQHAPDQHPRLIIAPHEIDETHLRALERWADACGFHHARLGMPSASTADVIIVDRVGALADLYACATVAYVGGGFHAKGLHSVVEPAVFHVPTVIGPQYASSRDAVTMRNAGGIIVADTAATLSHTLQTLFTTPQIHQQMSNAMAQVVSGELGAVDRSFEIVRELLGWV